ncbi:major royal jelly family protein [Parapedobacter koreensis]|uniref:Major royal jelly protein n=1 Tax=Parapedobacter koreensis TaxID=332977 RepID=A0A1H7LJH8_9SPHI|nr:major royal jelly family protein [Parapedobacter koreensis]SEK99080.1 Major royal jelly protein [Parapedobacter koreensis]
MTTFKKCRKTAILLTLLGTMTSLNTNGQQHYHSDKLIPVADLGKRRAIGVSVSSDNRLFVSFPNQGKDHLYGLTEIVKGQPLPFPDEAWNAHSGDSATRFVNVQDLSVDAEDNLWVLDSKPAPKGSIFGGPNGTATPAEGAFKLLKINLATNHVERVYTFDDLDKSTAGLNDMRIDTDKDLAYLSDPGRAAIVVLDLRSGTTRTVLQGHAYTTADPDIVLTYDGKEMRDRSGNPFRSNVNGIALTRDNRYFYFKPINKLNLYRIETQYLANASLTDTELASHVEDMGETTVTHGLIADDKGNIYLTSSMDYSIKYLSPDGTLHTLVQDSRLLWPDSFGIGSDGYLYFSCAQLQRDPQWNDGVDKVEYPYQIYKVKLP